MRGVAEVDVMRLLSAGLKVSGRQHKLIANNIANVDTPHYNPQELDFQKVLRSEIEGRGGLSLRKSHPRHLDGHRPAGRIDNLAILSKNDYNKVDLDDQLAKLSENRGRYVMYSRLVSKKFEMSKNLLTALNR